MEFRITSTSRRHSRQAGFTLVEFMIASGISVLAVAVFLSLGLFTARSIASMTDSVDLNARSRYAIDRMSKKLRQASVMNSFSSNSVSVTCSGQPLSYTYRSNLKTLTEIDGGRTNTLLKDCNNLTFAFYKRNPVTNSFDQFPVLTATNEAKVIQVQWGCSRSLIGKKDGTTEMVSSRIVLRSK